MIPRAECDVAAAQAVTLATDRLADPAKRATTDRAFSECFFIAVWFTSRHEVNEMFKYQHDTCKTMRSKFLIQRGKISQRFFNHIWPLNSPTFTAQLSLILRYVYDPVLLSLSNMRSPLSHRLLTRSSSYTISRARCTSRRGQSH